MRTMTWMGTAHVSFGGGHVQPWWTVLHGFWAQVAQVALLQTMNDLYVALPRYTCRSVSYDGCIVCVARSMLRGY